MTILATHNGSYCEHNHLLYKYFIFYYYSVIFCPIQGALNTGDSRHFCHIKKQLSHDRCSELDGGEVRGKCSLTGENKPGSPQ